MTAPTASRGFTAEILDQVIAERHEPTWMSERRRAAWKAYDVIPMPTQQDEEWRRTSLRTLKLDTASPLDTQVATQEAQTPVKDSLLSGSLTLVDAQLQSAWLAKQIEEQGVVVTDLRSALTTHPRLIEQYFMTLAVPATDNKFAALHGAFWDNGTLIYIPKGTTVELPLYTLIKNVTDGHACLNHTLLIADRDSQVHVIEELQGTTTKEQQFSSRVIELIVIDNAQVDFTSIQRFGPTVYDFYTIRAVQGRDSKLTLNTIELGSRLSKGRIETMLRGNGADSRLYGLYLGDNQQHYDRFTLQDHTGTNTTSDLLFKGVMSDNARSVYSGFIRMHPGAKQSRAYQQNRNILLSRTARADSIPNLEISENDILGCTHGATVGKVDEEEIFYLMSRGLSRIEATQLLVEGFVEPLIEIVPLTALQDSLRNEINQRVAETTAKPAQ
jgi:Fe-S cluster assembly protein SufD